MAKADKRKVVVTAEQIQKRVREMARQISKDYRDRTIHAVCVLENGFMFMADLVRELDNPVVCQFVKPEFHDIRQGGSTATEIFFSPEVEVKGQEVLLVECIVQTGITSEFLMRNLMGRGATSVKLAVLLDRQASRRISLQPEYSGFQIDESYVVGYSLGTPHLDRNLPYVAAVTRTSAAAPHS